MLIETHEKGDVFVDNSLPKIVNEMTSIPSSYSEWWKFITLPNEMEGFNLENIIGSGSTGQVYRAIQTKEYAIKVIRWRANSNQELAKHECDVAQLFNCCEETLLAFNYYVHYCQSFIVMEFGIPCLFYYIDRECSLREILNAILAVAKALDVIHSKGYSHFDVKPDNIMIVNGKAKLADFSHCSKFVNGQIYNRPIGTGIYTAPEITIGEKYTGKEDMYSLGITMYVLLMAGRLPFDFSGRESHKRERDDAIDSMFIHPELLSIIQKAAAYDAIDRYEGYNEFYSAIESFIYSLSDKVDEEMPLYRVCPVLQRTVISSTQFPWDVFDGDEQKSATSIQHAPLS